MARHHFAHSFRRGYSALKLVYGNAAANVAKPKTPFAAKVRRWGWRAVVIGVLVWAGLHGPAAAATKLVLGIATAAVAIYFAMPVVKKLVQRFIHSNAPASGIGYDGPTIYLGTTTGLLAANGHARGAASGVEIKLGARDISANILFLGETGAAKTSAGITPTAKHLLASGASFLFIDGKGDMAEPIAEGARRSGRVAKRIGIGALGINIIRGLSPQQCAKIAVDALHISGQTGADSAFWTSNVTSVVENALTVLGPSSSHYNLHDLYRFVFSAPFRNDRLADAGDRLALLQSRADAGDGAADTGKRALRMACDYFLDVYATMNEKTRNDVNATLATVLQRFQNPALVDAFCCSESEANLAELDDGVIFVLELPISQYDLGAQFVFLFVKEAVFRYIKNRASLDRDDPRRSRLIGIVTDEYQKIASSTDADSLDVIRSLGGFFVAGTQSVNALERVLGSKETTYALLQNFVQKICFGTSDVATIEYFATVIGEVDIDRLSRGTSKSPGGMGRAVVSSNESYSQQRVKVVTGQTFRNLSQDADHANALALLKINGHAYDDIIVLPKIYPENLAEHVRLGR